jgi:hypothetical protein
MQNCPAIVRWNRRFSEITLRGRSAFSDRKKCSADLFGTDIHHHGIGLAQDPRRVQRIENRLLRLKFTQQRGMLVVVQPKSHHGQILVHPNPHPGESSLPQTVAHPLMIGIVRRQKPDVLGPPATTSAIERMPKGRQNPYASRLGATEPLWPAHNRFMRLLCCSCSSGFALRG